MTTSGSVDFNLARDTIIQDALELVGVYEVGNAISAEDLTSAARSLEMMVKHWQTDGLHLWKQAEGFLFQAKSTTNYSLGSTGDNATESYVKTTLSADEALGSTALNVASITGISNSDFLGIELDDGTLQWTTVNGAPAGGVVTAAVGLTSAASSGNVVFAYTTKLVRPLRVTSTRLLYTNGNEIPVHVRSREDYQRLTLKGNPGKLVQVYYDPQLTNGVMYTWPTADDVTDVIKFTFTKPLEDFDATANTADFPQEWLLALSYGLAALLAPKYGLPIDERMWLKQEAEQYKQRVMEWDVENTSVYFQAGEGGD